VAGGRFERPLSGFPLRCFDQGLQSHFIDVSGEMTKKLSWVRGNCVVMSSPSKHGTELSDSDLLCRWCGQPVSVKWWKDGKRIYCSSRCLSAARFPLMLVCAAALTPILIGTILAPDAMFYFFVAGQGGTIPSGGLPLPLLALIWGEIAAACLSSLFLWYEAHVGWRVRQETREWRQMHEGGSRGSI
jgi:hypothetical protein